MAGGRQGREGGVGNSGPKPPPTVGGREVGLAIVGPHPTMKIGSRPQLSASWPTIAATIVITPCASTCGGGGGGRAAFKEVLRPLSDPPALSSL